MSDAASTAVLDRPATRRDLRGPGARREIVREALLGLSRNRFRAGLSMLGISWGIVSVVMLSPMATVSTAP